MEAILKAKETVDYIKSCQELTKYIDCSIEIPNEVQAEHNKALTSYRYLLYTLGVRSLNPKWHYNRYDKTTWKYINIDAKDRKYKGEILNPHFKFKGVY